MRKLACDVFDAIVSAFCVWLSYGWGIQKTSEMELGMRSKKAVI